MILGETLNVAVEVAVPAGVVTEMWPVTAPAGTVAVIDVGETILNRVMCPSNFTRDALLKFSPVIVTRIPSGPLVGVNVVMTGFLITVKAMAEVAVATAPVEVDVVTEILPVVAPAGTTALNALTPTSVNVPNVPLPNSTDVAPVKHDPWIRTTEPGGPAKGEKLEILGKTVNVSAEVAVP